MSQSVMIQVKFEKPLVIFL